MLKKNDITGFEKEYLWVNTSDNSVFQFYSDNTGIMVNEHDEEKSIKWEYLGSDEQPKNSFKIALDGSIFYFVIKEKNNNEFKVLFRSKTKNENIILERVSKPSIKDEIIKNDYTEVNIEKKESFEFSKLDTSDKIFMGFLLFITTILLSIIIKTALFFSDLSILMTLFFATISSLIIFIYLRDPIYFLSKKYKKQIEDIIFKK